MISKGQDLRSKHDFSMEEDSVFWVAGRQSEENVKILLEMVREYQKYQANLHLDENEQLDFDVKKTIMVFPGLTRAFKHKNDALDYLKHA